MIILDVGWVGAPVYLIVPKYIIGRDICKIIIPVKFYVSHFRTTEFRRSKYPFISLI